ncbi:hypothetical protein G6F64_014820 [Rhizopus arrhizus]|uniref:Uncharacterized protein n=1 Tax=Rhizopus oryzae TaxID=64495 RepID=A0A9P6WSW0_RHIOR|nr:hypothetical protein G6F64_014820 [Rhizopus arrhizus]
MHAQTAVHAQRQQFARGGAALGARAGAQRADGARHQAYYGGTGCAGKPVGGCGRRHRERRRNIAGAIARAGEDPA